jgi:FkbM family methyltransferase
MSAFSLKDTLPVALPAVEVCDVGAMIEGTERYAGLVAQGLARVTGFEPNPREYERLCAGKQGPYRYLPYFLGSGGPARFSLARYPGCSSLYTPDPRVIDLFTSIGAGPGGNFTVTDVQEVQTRRLDDLEECPAPDYLKIDVQGAELDVLRGATRALAGVVVLELEVEFVPLYAGQPLFGDIQVFLREHGFLLHKFLDVAGRCFRPLQLGSNPFAAMSQVLWADAVFVRDFTAVDRWTDEQLLKAALLLHEVYHSYDLVHYLLMEYDRRGQRELAPPYLRALVATPQAPPLYMNLKLQP